MHMAQIMVLEINMPARPQPHPTEEDTYFASTAQVACEGDTDLPHPRVFLELDDNERVVCPYCSRKFIYKK